MPQKSTILILFLTLFILFISIISSEVVPETSPYDFYTNLEGDDVFFDTLSDADLNSYFKTDQPIDVNRKLQSLSAFNYQTQVRVGIVGFLLDDPLRPRLKVSDDEVSDLLTDISKHSEPHQPLSWSPLLTQTIDYQMENSYQQLPTLITEALSKMAQIQLDKLISHLTNIRSQSKITPDQVAHSFIFRLSPAPIDDIIQNHLRLKTTSEMPHYIFYLAHFSPTVKLAGQTVTIKYVYSHTPREPLLLDGLLLKPNPRFDFSQHSIPVSYQNKNKNGGNPTLAKNIKSDTIFDHTKLTPIVWVDLTAEPMTFHGLPMQDVPILEITIPSLYINNQLYPQHTPIEMQKDAQILKKITKQFVMRLGSLTKHIVKNIFLSEYISKAPLLTLSTKVNIIHIADHYNSSNLSSLLKQTSSPNQFKTVIQQLQGIAPRGYIVDVDITPVPLSTCTLCLNSINNALRSDPSHVMGGPDGKYLDSSTMFDLFHAFNIEQWSPHSRSATVQYQHLNDGTVGGQFYPILTNTKEKKTNQQQEPTYQRVITVWAIEPSPEIQQKFQATFLFDKMYQTVANTDKTRVLSIMNPLPPVAISATSMAALSTTNIIIKDVGPNNIQNGGSYREVNNLISTPQLSLYTTLVSVIYGYGSSKSIVFPGGAPVLDSLYVLEGTHPPYANKVTPTPIDKFDKLDQTGPMVTLTSTTTVLNIWNFHAQLLVADILNTISAALTTIHDYKIDMSLIPSDAMNNIIIRIALLENKLKTVRLSLLRRNFNNALDEKSIPYSTMSQVYQKLHSARHDIGWLLLFFHNIVQKQEPVTICSHDVIEHSNTVHGLTDLISHYWSSEVSPALSQYVNLGSEEDLQKEKAKALNEAHLKSGFIGLDNDINVYLQNQHTTPYWIFALDVFLIVFVVCFCCLCCVLGRKRRQTAINMVTEAFSGDDNGYNANAPNNKTNSQSKQKASTSGWCSKTRNNNNNNNEIKFDQLPVYGNTKSGGNEYGL